MEVSGHLHAPAALPPGKEPLVPIGLEPALPPEPVLDAVVKKKILATAGTRTTDHPARSPALLDLCQRWYPTTTLHRVLRLFKNTVSSAQIT
jgi:hypothetical protein